MTKTVVVEAALSIQTPSAITMMPASAASQTGASSGRRRRLAYSLRMRAMIPRPWVLLLAAGGSRRFGSPNYSPALTANRCCVAPRAWRSVAALAGCIVVLGANAIRLERELRDWPVDIVVNRDWRRGLSSSLRAGLAALPATAPAALVMLADQAALGPADLELLIAAWRRQPRAIVAARAGDVPARRRSFRAALSAT